jgi:hypothetical protein
VRLGCAVRITCLRDGGTQVGYIDSVDLYSRQGDEPLDVKDSLVLEAPALLERFVALH